VVRQRILTHGSRPDGRTPTEIRPIWCEVGISPRAHGSGLFTRGETQVLTLATLGTPKEALEIDDLTPTETKRYIHHYNFPPYSTGEVKPLRGNSRREIGHGALAERALVPVLPPQSEFPYTMRLVSEVLSSNGSTSMASVCGSTLALMDTGVPIKAPVAGVAMGLIKDGSNHVVLTDIQGLEDHLGDMDFKVAGTRKGITAIQMDIKIAGITPEILREALAKACSARNRIIDIMEKAIPKPRPDLSLYAPRITTIVIDKEKIGEVIGPGGRVIREIQENTGATITIEEDGTVQIFAADKIAAEAAVKRIKGIVAEPEVGAVYEAKVKSIVDFGAFVEYMPGKEGLVHISELDTKRVARVEDIVKLGDVVKVKLIGIERGGKVRLSMKALL
jgi:polyribonucleotide nucleotidyltransferase